jgi:integrase
VPGHPQGQRRARRAVTIPEFVTFEIAEHLRRCPPGPSGLVFTAPKGGPIRRQTFLPPSLGAGATGRRISRASGSGSCATLARRWRWRGGANPVIVAFRLGHTSTRMVEQHYAGRLDRADKEIASALDAAARYAARGGNVERAVGAARRLTCGFLERTTGLEPATPTLARWCSTN